MLTINDSIYEKMDENTKNKITRMIEKYHVLEEETGKITNTYQIRFQDYFDLNMNSRENLDYFIENCPNHDEGSILLYCQYILDELTDDIFYLLQDETIQANELVELMDDFHIFDDSNAIFDYATSMIDKRKDTIDPSNSTNLLLTSFHFDELMNALTKNNTGSEEISIKKTMMALKTLSEISYTNPENSRNIHKVIDNNRDHDVRLTNKGIMLERYSTSGSTKVVFLKMPIIPQNLEIIRDLYSNDRIENIYYIAGMGDFSYSGYSEPDFYKMFIKQAYKEEHQIENVVELLSKPLVTKENGIVVEDKTIEFMELMDGSYKNLKEMEHYTKGNSKK